MLFHLDALFSLISAVQSAVSGQWLGDEGYAPYTCSEAFSLSASGVPELRAPGIAVQGSVTKELWQKPQVPHPANMLFNRKISNNTKGMQDNPKVLQLPHNVDLQLP